MDPKASKLDVELTWLEGTFVEANGSAKDEPVELHGSEFFKLSADSKNCGGAGLGGGLLLCLGGAGLGGGALLFLGGNSGVGLSDGFTCELDTFVLAKGSLANKSPDSFQNN